MSFFGRLRLDIRRERVDIADREEGHSLPPKLHR